MFIVERVVVTSIIRQNTCSHTGVLWSHFSNEDDSLSIFYNLVVFNFNISNSAPHTFIVYVICNKENPRPKEQNYF